MEAEPHTLVFLFSVSLTGLAPIDNGVNDQCGVEERRGRWPQRSWAAGVLIFQAILRR
jgi:hypothetical protein